MKVFQQKRQMMSRMYSRPVLVFIVILIVFLGKGVWDIYGRERESARMRRDSAAKLENLENQKEDLTAQVERLSESAGIEDEIRSKFNVAKPGENVVLIVSDATTTATSTPGFFASLWAKIWK